MLRKCPNITFILVISLILQNIETIRFLVIYYGTSIIPLQCKGLYWCKAYTNTKLQHGSSISTPFSLIIMTNRCSTGFMSKHSITWISTSVNIENCRKVISNNTRSSLVLLLGRIAFYCPINHLKFRSREGNIWHKNYFCKIIFFVF